MQRVWQVLYPGKTHVTPTRCAPYQSARPRDGVMPEACLWHDDRAAPSVRFERDTATAVSDQSAPLSPPFQPLEQNHLAILGNRLEPAVVIDPTVDRHRHAALQLGAQAGEFLPQPVEQFAQGLGLDLDLTRALRLIGERAPEQHLDHISLAAQPAHAVATSAIASSARPPPRRPRWRWLRGAAQSRSRPRRARRRGARDWGFPE